MTRRRNMKNRSVLLASILIISIIISGCSTKNSDESSENIKNVLTTSSIIPKEEKYISSDLDDS
jgi:lipoprotein